MAIISDYLYCDKKECNLGESITFKFDNQLTYNLGELTFGSNGINIYEDNVLIDSNIRSSFYEINGYSYTPSTSGTHTIKFEGSTYITVEITVTEPLIPTGSWSIGNKEVASLTINNKEVQSIVRVSDDAILYEKAVDNRINSVLTITSPSGSSMSKLQSVNGYLKDTNNNSIANKTLSVYIDNTLLKNNILSANDGWYTTGYIFSNYGDNNNHIIKITFEGDSEYKPSTVEKTFNISRMAGGGF